MMICVIQAKYINQYKIHLLFNDKREGIVDLENIITTDPRPIFKALIDIQKFKNFKVAADTIVWENGLDLAPEFLYKQITNHIP